MRHIIVIGEAWSAKLSGIAELKGMSVKELVEGSMFIDQLPVFPHYVFSTEKYQKLSVAIDEEVERM